MLSGRDALQVINEQIRQIQADLEAANRQLETAGRRVTALNQDLGETYRRLARIRLSDLMAKRVIGKLDETEQVILRVLKQRDAALKDLHQRIAESLARQKHLEDQRKDLAERRDAAGNTLKERLEKALKRIRASEPFIAQLEKRDNAEEVARRAEEKALQAEADRKEKGSPYESDSLFMYLWKRRYLTPDYSAGRFTRSLDDWVAKLIDFPRNRANYHLLVEIPAHLRKHALAVKKKAEQEAEALTEIEEKETAREGIPALQAQVEDLEKKLAAHDSEIEAEEDHYRELIEDQTRFGEMADPQALHALNLQEEDLKGESLDELVAQALATAGTEDDAAVNQLQELQREIGFAKREILNLRELQEQRQKSLVEMENLRRRYRREGYDAYHTNFPGDFSMGTLLTQLLAGALSSEAVWREIGRHHRSWPGSGGTRQPSGSRGNTWGGSWPTGRTDRPSRSKGGFRTGGTF